MLGSCTKLAIASCDGWFNAQWFPSYEETYLALQSFSTSEAFLVAGLLAGRVLYDPARAACAVESVRYFALPAGDGGSSGT